MACHLHGSSRVYTLPRSIGPVDPKKLKLSLYSFPLKSDWREFARDDSYPIEYFAKESWVFDSVTGEPKKGSWADRFGGKFRASDYVYVLIGNREYRFLVEPHDANWFDRLRLDMCRSAGLNTENSGAIRLFFSDGTPVASDHKHLIRLFRAKRMSICFKVADRPSPEESRRIISLPLKPVFEVYLKDEKPKVAVDCKSDHEQFDKSASDAAAKELADMFASRVLKDLPALLAVLVNSGDFDFLKVNEHISDAISSDGFYPAVKSAQSSAYKAFWSSTGCPDPAAAVTEIAHDISKTAMKVDTGSNEEIYRRSLIGSELWERMRWRFRNWRHDIHHRLYGHHYHHHRHRHYRPLPPGEVYHSHQLIGSGIAQAKAVNELHAKLIACSRHENQYCDEDSESDDESDSEPDHHSIACYHKKAHYRRSGKQTKLEPNSTVYEYEAKPRAATPSLLPEYKSSIKCRELKRLPVRAPSQTQSQTVIIQAIPESQLTCKKMSNKIKKPFDASFSKNSTAPNGLQNSVYTKNAQTPIDAPPTLQGITCNACGGKGKKKDGIVQPISCNSCGGTGKKKVQPSEHELWMDSLQMIDCNACGGKDKKKDKSQQPPSVTFSKGTIDASKPRILVRFVNLTGASVGKISVGDGRSLEVGKGQTPTEFIAVSKLDASFSEHYGDLGQQGRFSVYLLSSGGKVTVIQEDKPAYGGGSMPDPEQANVKVFNGSDGPVDAEFYSIKSDLNLRTIRAPTPGTASSSVMLTPGVYTIRVKRNGVAIAEFSGATVNQRNSYTALLSSTPAAPLQVTWFVDNRFGEEKNALASRAVAELFPNSAYGGIRGMLIVPSNDKYKNPLSGVHGDYMSTKATGAELMQKKNADGYVEVTSDSGVRYVFDENNTGVYSAKLSKYVPVLAVTPLSGNPNVFLVVIDGDRTLF